MPIRVQTPEGIAEFPDGTDPAVMKAALLKRFPPPPPAAPQKPDTSHDSFTDYLPAAGGAVGGLLGGSKGSPVGIALAGMGGAAGEAGKQVIDILRGNMADVPSPGIPQLKKIATEGLKQAGWETGGQALNQLAKPLYYSALKPTLAMMRDVGGGKGRALVGLNRILTQGLDDAVLPSAMGVNRAEKLTEASRAVADQIAEKGPRIPNRQTVPVSYIANTAKADQAARMATELKGAGVAPRPDAVAEQLGRLTDANPTVVNTGQLQGIKREAGKIAEPAFAAAHGQAGGRVPLGSEASVAQSVNRASGGVLDQLLGDAYKQANKTTIARRGVENAVKAAAVRPSTLQNMLEYGGGLGVGFSHDPLSGLATYALLKLLGSRTAKGGLAIGMSKMPFATIGHGISGMMDDEQ